MDILKRELAPIAHETWQGIDDEARRVLNLQLAGRKVVDISGPHGWTMLAVNTGRLTHFEAESAQLVGHALRDVQPLLELRTPFQLDILEMDYAARGAKDVNLDAVVAASERMAHAEDTAIFHGLTTGKIVGIVDASPHAALRVESKVRWPQSIGAARETLRVAGIGGPYALVLSAAAYDEITAESEEGYPLRQRVQEVMDGGPLVWAPALRTGAVLMTNRGGDFELVIGQDLSIGYAFHDREHIELYLTETFTFRVLEPKAAISLERQFEPPRDTAS
ncbi:MAG: family 1 encapsulin nanocompartment shell protein [Polyangiaceae bacterium]